MSAFEPRPRSDRSVQPGQRTMMAVIVLTGVVVAFAAVIAVWMYWIQGASPS
ncbi:MAG TPA: hypothetical protein VH723_06220 [Candidatus Limnocylindrales bacterium]